MEFTSMAKQIVKGFVFVGAMLYLLYFVSTLTVRAQDLPPAPKTVFSGHCQRSEPDGVTVFWGYEATGGDHWIGSGLDIVTLPGSHPDLYQFFMPIDNPIIPVYGLGRWVDYDDPAMLAFSGIQESTFVVFNLDMLPACADPEATPEPTQQPTPNGSESCDYRAINAGTGLPYCYIPQSGGLIPLPPSSEAPNAKV